MCIRDRNKTDDIKVQRTEMVTKEIDLAQENEVFDPLDTVSYTHLDVYKRQDQFRINRSGGYQKNGERHRPGGCRKHQLSAGH